MSSGWFEDPEVPGSLRYFDGEVWTEHTAAAPSDSALPPFPPPPPGSGVGGGSVSSNAGLRLSSFGRRLGAHFIDGVLSILVFLVAGIPAIIMIAAGSETTGRYDSEGYEIFELTSLGWFGVSLFGLAGLISLVFAFWNGVFRVSRKGASLGKSQLGMVVVSHGANLSLGKAFGRQILQYLSAQFLFVGHLWMLWDSDERTLYDRVLDADVIDVS